MSANPVVLYVEDDHNSCDIMRLLLESELGFEHLTIFEDSANFLARAENLYPAPDIILLDIHVGPHDGFEMLTMLRGHNNFRNTPVMALTASVMNEEVKKLKTAGFNGVVSKPVNLETFPQTLGMVLEGHQIWRIVD